LSDPRPSGNISSADQENEVIILEQEVIFLEEIMHIPSSSDEAEQSDPETEMVSFTLALNHLCAARMFPMSVLSVVY